MKRLSGSASRPSFAAAQAQPAETLPSSPAPAAVTQNSAPASAAPANVATVDYTVVSGDSLWKIARDHRTSVANAKKRGQFMHQAVVNAFGNGPIEGEIADLLEWMDLFHPESLIELDYGGLAIYMDHMLRDVGGLSEDTSQEDLLFSLAGLAKGEGVMAGQGYERLMGRWRRLAGDENAS